MTRRIMRFVPYTVAQDMTAWPEYVARCVSGDERECGADSGSKSDPTDVEKWMAAHLCATGHQRFRRTFADYAQFSPQGDVPRPRVIAGAVVEDSRVMEPRGPLELKPLQTQRRA